MASFDVKNLEGQKIGEIELDDAVFGTEVKEHLLWEVVKYQQAKQRAGTHSTLRRREVRGGGKKPYRQKGTGNARQGSTRAPHFVGGGSVFGPKPRSYAYPVPKKVRRGALTSALSLRAKESKLIILDQFNLLISGEEEKKRLTQQVSHALRKLGAPSALIVDTNDNNWLALGTRNLTSAQYLAPEGVNVYDVLKYDALILTRTTALALQERLRPQSVKQGESV
jgi:large subunit ribosomal protein L4